MSSVPRLRAAKTLIATVAVDTLAQSQRILIGHSGASVILHNQGLNSFVRKTAVSVAASARLRSQAEKQHSLWMLGMPFPRVLAQGIDAFGRATFDMAYIPGRTVADAVADAASFDAATVVKAVERMIWLFTTCAGMPLPPRLFEDKIAEVVRLSTAATDDIATIHEIQSCGQRLICQEWSGIPESPCHGDLTLENILLTARKSIAFIDCDDSFAASYWLDFGKLFQDIDGHWCIRNLYEAEVPQVRRVNALQKLEQLGGRFRALAASADPALSGRLPQLAALSLFRAIPYAKSHALVSFLCQRIAHVLEI